MGLCFGPPRIFSWSLFSIFLSFLYSFHLALFSFFTLSGTSSPAIFPSGLFGKTLVPLGCILLGVLSVLGTGSLLSYIRDKDLTTSTGYVYSDWFTRGRHGPCRYRDYKMNFTSISFLPSSLCTQSHPVVVVDQPGTRWVLGAWVSEVCVSGNG